MSGLPLATGAAGELVVDATLPRKGLAGLAFVVLVAAALRRRQVVRRRRRARFKPGRSDRLGSSTAT